MPAGDLKKELLNELGRIPALVQQLQFVVKNPTVGKPATFAKVDSVIRETKLLMEAVNRVVTATLSCRQHVSTGQHDARSIVPRPQSLVSYFCLLSRRRRRRHLSDWADLVSARRAAPNRLICQRRGSPGRGRARARSRRQEKEKETHGAR